MRAASPTPVRVAAHLAEKCLACGVRHHGLGRIRYDACTHEYSLTLSRMCRDHCPRCHAKRRAIRTQWLDTTLPAPVPHRQLVLIISKRLRAYCRYRRREVASGARQLQNLARRHAESIAAVRHTRLCSLAPKRAGSDRSTCMD